jgi:hypothetical protein
VEVVVFADSRGVPIAWIADQANRNDCVMLEPTLAAVDDRGLLGECDTLHLDRGYNNSIVRDLVERRGITLVCAKIRRTRRLRGAKKTDPLGLRWPIERTNSWLSNFGQLRRNTDRKTPTASPSSPSRSSRSSPPSSSTGATAGALSARPLSLDDDHPDRSVDLKVSSAIGISCLKPKRTRSCVSFGHPDERPEQPGTSRENEPEWSG